jgi:hypothetical protein
VLVSLSCLLITLIAQPYRYQEDHLFAVSAQAALLVSFIGASYLKVFDDIDDKGEDASLPHLASDVFGFNSSDGIVNVLFSFLIGILVLLLAILTLRLREEGYVQVIHKRTTGKPLKLPLIKGKKYHMFLSYHWRTGQDAAATIKRQLQRHIPNVRIFIDLDDLEDVSNLKARAMSSTRT